MPISRSERDVLFGTPIVYRQMNIYLSAHKTCTVEQLRAEFYDISNGCFYSALFNLTARDKLIQKEGNKLVYIGTAPIKGHMADKVWKAAVIKGTFTTAQLSTLTDVDAEYISDLCRLWVIQGYLAVIGKEKNGRHSRKIYRMLSSNPIRPAVTPQKKGAKE